MSHKYNEFSVSYNSVEKYWLSEIIVHLFVENREIWLFPFVNFYVNLAFQSLLLLSFFYFSNFFKGEVVWDCKSPLGNSKIMHKFSQTGLKKKKSI